MPDEPDEPDEQRAVIILVSGTELTVRETVEEVRQRLAAGRGQAAGGGLFSVTQRDDAPTWIVSEHVAAIRPRDR